MPIVVETPSETYSSVTVSSTANDVVPMKHVSGPGLSLTPFVIIGIVLYWALRPMSSLLLWLLKFIVSLWIISFSLIIAF